MSVAGCWRRRGVLSGLVFFVILCFAALANAQGTNQILAPATKVNYAVGKWRYSGEFQVRLDEDYRALNVWYLEGVVTNLRFKHVELVPDLRFSVKPKIVEVRPGFGVILKATGP